MKELIIALAVSALAIGSAAGQGAPVPGACESKAMTKDGKPLAASKERRYYPDWKCPLHGLEAIGHLPGHRKNGEADQ